MDDSMVTPLDLARERINILNIIGMPDYYDADREGGVLSGLRVSNMYLIQYEFQYKPLDTPHTWYKGVIFLKDIYDMYKIVYKTAKELKAELEK